MTYDKNYYATREHFTPEKGRIYTNTNGLQYTCIKVDRYSGNATFRAVKGTYGKWQCICYGIGIYVDGRIDWDYSKNGCFV